MNGSVTGYNKEQVEALRDKINAIAERSCDFAVQYLYDQIIVPISTAWYAPEAVEFFEGFKEQVSLTGQKITEVYDQFRDAIEKAGAHWAENTNGEPPVLPKIDLVELNLNISPIQPTDANGNISIDEEAATAVANGLSELENSIRDRMAWETGALSAETSFIGHNQAEAARECFRGLMEIMKSLFSYLTDGEDSLQGQINKAVAKYQAVAQDVQSGFDNTNF